MTKIVVPGPIVIIEEPKPPKQERDGAVGCFILILVLLGIVLRYGNHVP